MLVDRQSRIHGILGSDIAPQAGATRNDPNPLPPSVRAEQRSGWRIRAGVV